MPKVSIIIPVYNVEPYLRECLDSVRAQTFTDWECICVDDGSTDASPAILDEYAARDPRFRTIKREHTNAGASRNVGLDIAQGEFLSFLDSDDIFAPQMLEILLSAIEQCNADVSTCEIVRFRDGDRVPQLGQRNHRGAFREYCRPAESLDIFSIWVGRAWDKLFRRDFIVRNGICFQEIRSTNDARFTYSALALANAVISVPFILVAYRVSSGSLERTRHLGATCPGEAIRSYAAEMHRRGVFERYPSHERFFKRWAVITLFWNMDTIRTFDGYAEAHRDFSAICRELDLQSVVDQWEDGKSVNRKRLANICHGCSPEESLLLMRDLFFSVNEELRELRPLRGIANSKSYRLGRAVTYLPRIVRRLFRLGH